MGYLVSHKRSKLFNEFSEDNQKKYFNLTQKKYIHHVDTFYYSIFIKGDYKDDKKEVSRNSISFRVDELINFLKIAKEDLAEYDGSRWFDYEKSLLLTKKNFSIYNNCISKDGFYDIFISNYLPNNSTPRIVVQLRSIGLWSIGEYELIKESYLVVKEFLSEYGLEIHKTQENRIDFCYHTNCLQNPEKFYDDDCLKNNCFTNLKIFQKVGKKNGKELEIDYLSFGRRQSNNIFFRSYNKVREVIEENYKDFFLELWYNSGMINYYDFYVYTYAYKKHSFSQIYVGMMEFYLEFGIDPNVKKYLNNLKSRKYTIEELKQYIIKICPIPTLVINIEFQTMRKFYYTFRSALDHLPIIHECEEKQLLRLYQLLDCRKEFLNYLTDTTISFRNANMEYLDFWQRLRNVKFDKIYNGTLSRDYSTKINRDIIVSKIKNLMATLSLYDNNFDTDINEDMSNLICVLNDNDFKINDDGTCSIIDNEYIEKKEKIKKALKSKLQLSRPSINI